MRILLAIIAIAAVVGLLFILLRSQSASKSLATPEKMPPENLGTPEQIPSENLVTPEEIPAVVAKLQSTAKDSSFAVFMFEPAGNPGGAAVNLQYSIENGAVGLDWVLLSPRNIADEKALTAFITRSGHKISEHEMNDVRYLRVEGSGISELGVKICREFYRLPPDKKIELLTEDF